MLYSFIMRIQRRAFLRAMISWQSVPGSMRGQRLFMTEGIMPSSFWAVAKTACLWLVLALMARR